MISPTPSSTKILDIISHEVRTPLHTMQQSLRSLERIVTRLGKPSKTNNLTHINTYLCYMNASLKRLCTFIKTGQPADYEEGVQEEKLFSDIFFKAIAPVDELEKAMKNLQNIHNTLMKPNSVEPFPLDALVSHIDIHLNKIKSQLDALAQLIPVQNSTPIEPNEVDSVSPSPDKISVLIVEDNKINIKLLARILQKKKYTVDVAYNGAEGVELFSAGKYDVVFMDIHMPPGIDGYETAGLIRKKEGEVLTQTPIITLTANADTEENREKARAAGMNDFLSKPYNPKAIYELIKKHSPKAKAAPPSPPPEKSESDIEVDLSPSSPIKSETPKHKDITSINQLPLIGLMGTTHQKIHEEIIVSGLKTMSSTFTAT